MVLRMLFLTLSNINIQFFEEKLTWKSYTTVKALLITKQVELINKKGFVKMVLDKNSETFLMYVAALEALLAGMWIYSDKEA